MVQGAGPDLTTATDTIHKTSKPLVSMLVGFQVVNVKVLTFLIYSSMTIYLGICDDCDLTFLIRWLSQRRASAFYFDCDLNFNSIQDYVGSDKYPL